MDEITQSNAYADFTIRFIIMGLFIGLADNGLKYFLEEHFHQIHICGTFILHEYVDSQRMNALLTKYAGSPANIFNS